MFASLAIQPGRTLRNLKHILERRNGSWKVISAQNRFISPISVQRLAVSATSAKGTLETHARRTFAVREIETEARLNAAFIAFRLGGTAEEPRFAV